MRKIVHLRKRVFYATQRGTIFISLETKDIQIQKSETLRRTSKTTCLVLSVNFDNIFKKKILLRENKRFFCKIKLN